MRTAILALALALTTTSAFADFRPGRVRAGAVSEMEVVKATGVFEGQKSVKLYMNYEDGKADPVSMTLDIPGMTSGNFKIMKIKRSGCGDQFVASKEGMMLNAIKLTLVDYSNITCRLFAANKWHANLQITNDMDQIDQLEMQGNPEYLAVTM